jgi:hypothetical protein
MKLQRYDRNDEEPVMLPSEAGTWVNVYALLRELEKHKDVDTYSFEHCVAASEITKDLLS